MEGGGVLGVLGVILGYILRPLGDWVREALVTRKERARRRAEFQDETLLKLQQALYDCDQTAWELDSKGFLATGQTDAAHKFQDAQNRELMARVLLEDEELVDAVKKFHAAALLQATGQGSMAVMDQKQSNLTKANERIGVLRRKLQ